MCQSSHVPSCPNYPDKASSNGRTRMSDSDEAALGAVGVEQQQAVDGDAECPHADVERLKQMLVERARTHDRFRQELQARDFERWQLFQLLHQKNERLSWHEGDGKRKCTVLAVAQETVRCYLAFSVLRAWRDHVQRLASKRLLSNVKSRLVSTRLRYACAGIRITLNHAVGRQVGGAMRKLWLHSAARVFSHDPPLTDLDSLAEPKAPELLDSGFGAASTHKPDIRILACSGYQAARVLDASSLRCTSSSPWIRSVRNPSELSPPPHPALPVTLSSAATSLRDSHNDQAHCINPKHDSPVACFAFRAVRDSSPQPRERRPCCASAPSEISTCAPSSLSRHSRSGCLTAAGRTIAGARLAIAIGLVGLQRLLWAVGWWHVQTRAHPAEECVSEVVVEKHEVLATEVGELRLRCGALEHHVCSAARAEAALSTKLVDAQVREATLEHASNHAEERFEQHWNDELREVKKLRLKAQVLQEGQARYKVESERSAKRGVELERLLGCAERSCEELESRLARKLRWCGEREEQIREMAACGENLEGERARLRWQLGETQQQRRRSCEQVQTLRQSLESEEQLGEILQARAAALEEDNSGLAGCLQLERHHRLQDATRHSAELSAAQHASDELHVALLEAGRSRVAVELRATEATRRDLLAAWGDERARRTRKHGELEREVASALTELEVSQRVEATEARAAAGAWDSARSALRLELRSDGSALHDAVRAEFVEEWEICKQMVAQLEHWLGQVRQLQEGFEISRAARAAPDDAAAHVSTSAAPHRFLPTFEVSGAPCATSPQLPGTMWGTAVSTPRSGPETAQLQELDAYAKLVERLQVEVYREREERKASAQSLEALRGSYRLLLERVGISDDGGMPRISFGRDTDKN